MPGEDRLEPLPSVLGSAAARKFVALPRRAVLWGARILGLLTGDVVLTREEIDGLADNLLVSGEEPTGRTRLSDWLAGVGESLGREWASELGRHYR